MAFFVVPILDILPVYFFKNLPHHSHLFFRPYLIPLPIPFTPWPETYEFLENHWPRNKEHWPTHFTLLRKNGPFYGSSPFPDIRI